jgi:CelD/BcsL family acetyltransferase involved in cellulose biosynthesis
MIAFGVIPDFNFDSAEYRALFERSGATAFQHPDWLAPIYRHLASANSGEPLVICGRDSVNGSLVLVVPLIKRRFGETIVVEYASRGVTDYACPILSPEALADQASTKPACRIVLVKEAVILGSCWPARGPLFDAPPCSHGSIRAVMLIT